jgi:cyclophilin family peptidyl-prolyl cis-trans isomerase/HEAT repeat protein
MKRSITIFITLFFLSSIQTIGQAVDSKDVPMGQLLPIIQAEDELRYDKTLSTFIKHPNPHVRKRASLAAGRIGDEEAISLLATVLEKDLDNVRQMAAFSIGEIESLKGADAILKALSDKKINPGVRSRAIEAAGKIAATARDNEKSKMLGKAIVDNLEFEAGRRDRPSGDVILLGITAVLRARPEGAENTLAKFLRYKDWRIRADVLNTLARLRAQNVNNEAADLLDKDENPIVRANAARVLGAAGDENSLHLILDKAITDKDLRVRINAIRALGGLDKKKGSAGKLIERAGKLLADYKKSKYENPPEENELLTIASALGNILRATDDPAAVKFLEDFRTAEKHTSPEVEIALVRVSPAAYARTKLPKDITWQGTAGFVAGLGESADLKEGRGHRELQAMAKTTLSKYIEDVNLGRQKPDKAFPAILGAYANFKTDDLPKILRDSLRHDDVIIRSRAASLLGNVEPDKDNILQNYFSLTNTFGKSQNDKLNDAALASLDALKKQYEKLKNDKTIRTDLLEPFKLALRSHDYLVRRSAFEIFKELKITPEKPESYDQVSFKPGAGGLSRVIRTDYKKALSRKNGQWGATIRTSKGNIEIEFFPEEAPLTVDNFIRLANMKYFNGLAIHRVVPNFVVQDGDPRGDGSGGPGWQIRCEINQIPYRRGMVGMALSGKDTGGSQWFVTHSPQPHLDGGYTIFGKVNENDMKIVDKLARGDKILSVSVFRLAVKRVAEK